MKKVALSLAALLATATMSMAQTTWKLDRSHSKLAFSVSHLLVSETDGEFKNFELNLTSKSDDFTGANIELTADVNTIDTDNEQRDNHLKAEEYFNAAKYPKLVFKGKELKKVSGKNYKLTGDLTMRGVTKPVTLDVVYGGTIQDPWKNTRAGFIIKGTVNRQDFGIAAGKGAVGDEVSIVGKIEVTRQ